MYILRVQVARPSIKIMRHSRSPKQSAYLPICLTARFANGSRFESLQVLGSSGTKIGSSQDDFVLGAQIVV